MVTSTISDVVFVAFVLDGPLVCPTKVKLIFKDGDEAVVLATTGGGGGVSFSVSVCNDVYQKENTIRV
jgi:hypothetical protein